MKVKNEKEVSVVVIDSDRVHAEEMEAILITEGYHVALAKNIESYLELTNGNADVGAVLFELEGSLGDIKHKINMLKAKTNKEALIIMMSAFSIDALKLAVSSGCHEFLAKPVGRDQLLPILERKRNGTKPRKISMTIKLEATIQEE